MAARTKKVIRNKKRFHPVNHEGAISLINQAIKAMLKEEPLPSHVANYLLEAFYSIKKGEDAKKALSLSGKAGHYSKNIRNFLFRKAVDENRALGMTRNEAILQEQGKFSMHPKELGDISFTAETSYKEGEPAYEFYKKIVNELGQECADDYLEMKIQKLRM